MMQYTVNTDNRTILHDVASQRLRSDLSHIKTIHIFCNHQDDIRVIENLMLDYGFRFDMNNFNISLSPDCLLLYHHIKSLTPETNSFLLRKISKGIHVLPLISFLEKKFKYTPIELLNDDYFLINDNRSEFHNFYLFLKKGFDILFSLLMLFFFSPFYILIAIAIKLDSKGPVLYKQSRTGFNNGVFNIYKFRTMRTDAEANGAQWAAENDDRVTGIGKFLRRTRLDEVPQFFNILRGDMALIGPRPERPIFVEDLEKEIPYYNLRHHVKPGLTGWAQVNFPYGASFEDAQWKHRYDMWYLYHHSLLLDLLIILKTIKVVLFKMGR